LGSFTSSNLSGAVTDETGTGSAVFATSPTLVTPALGTPSALVGTNITGTASGLTAGGVTTNANLTGMVTSSGNATTVVTNANLTGEVTSTGNATTLTNSAVIGKVLTGFTSGAGTIIATDNILEAVQKLDGNNGNFVDLTTAQTVAGAKTFSSDIKVGTLEIKASATNQNTLIGTGVTSPTGSDITAIGFMALNGNTGIDDNTAIGSNALRNSGATSGNTAIGESAGGNNGGNTGGNNTFIGKGAVLNYVSTSISNATAIGNGSEVAASNSIQLGNTAVTNVKTSGTITAGTVTIPNIHGTANQVLATNGSGTLAWATPASSGATNVTGLSDALLEDNSIYLGNDPSNTTSTAEYNVAVGTTALDAITTGDKNTAIGYDALGANNSGWANSAIGYQSLSSNTSAFYNSSFGYQSLLNSTTGGYNTAIGSGVLKLNSTGTFNTGLGAFSLYSNTTASTNTGIGYSSLYNNTTGTNNTAVGAFSLNLNTTAHYNTAMGNYSLNLNTTGEGNTSTGYYSLQKNTIASYNTAIGYKALMDANRTADANAYNTALGYNAGNTGTNDITTGDKNVLLGASTAASQAAASNQIVIGYGAKGAADNTVQLGNTSITNVKTSGTITAGVVTYPNTHNSTAGQVLITDASGVANWGSAAATVREVADETSAASSQTSFTLTQTPSANSKVKMYINGIRISNTAYSVSGATLTYTAANNGSYALTASDRIQFDYYY
jgi:hypothetical protein